MLRAGRVSRVYFWTVGGAIIAIIIATFVVLISSNPNPSQNEASSTISEPSGALKPAQAAPSSGRSTGLAPRADDNTSTKQ